MATVLHSAPRIASNDGVRESLSGALGSMLVEAREEHGEILLRVERQNLEAALRLLRDEHAYQQLMEIAGADYPDRAERFEVVYMLLSLTKNHRIMVKVRAAEDQAVPTATTLWPNAGWLEREVFDMYGVVFDGNTDLRRILTDYGFEGHPFRKDFPLTGYQELRYSEEQRRVVYEPVELAQDLRQFDFMSPWEGADYVLPGDEKVAENPAPPPVSDPKTTEKKEQTGAGEKTDEKAAETVSDPAPAETETADETKAPEPTQDRPGQPKRKGKTTDTAKATQPKDKKPAAKKPTTKKAPARKTTRKPAAKPKGDA